MVITPVSASENAYEALPEELATHLQVYEPVLQAEEAIIAEDGTEAFQVAKADRDTVSVMGGYGGVHRVDGEYVAVFPIYYNSADGQYYTLDNEYRVRWGGLSTTYVDLFIKTETIDAWAAGYTQYGLYLAGWYIEGSIKLDVYRAGTFTYRATTSEGISGSLGKVARDGSNIFVIQSNLPSDPADFYSNYTYGMSGT